MNYMWRIFDASKFNSHGCWQDTLKSGGCIIATAHHIWNKTPGHTMFSHLLIFSGVQSKLTFWEGFHSCFQLSLFTHWRENNMTEKFHVCLYLLFPLMQESDKNAFFFLLVIFIQYASKMSLPCSYHLVPYAESWISMVSPHPVIYSEGRWEDVQNW